MILADTDDRFRYIGTCAYCGEIAMPSMTPFGYVHMCKQRFMSDNPLLPKFQDRVNYYKKTTDGEKMTTNLNEIFERGVSVEAYEKPTGMLRWVKTTEPGSGFYRGAKDSYCDGQYMTLQSAYKIFDIKDGKELDTGKYVWRNVLIVDE